jgi:hypothetical protein
MILDVALELARKATPADRPAGEELPA